MIPLSLSLSGFLSYRDPVELDFTRFDLACISGPNGAGKSSLLDAITWALFGQARKRDESLIHAASSVAEVALVFQYEGNIYRVQRTLPRGKTSLLEFQIAQSTEGASPAWRALTEATLRATQARLEQTLRLDYETFVNASFFLQGKADQFTQQRPADRKRILASILGLEIWDVYRQCAADRRKIVEGEIAALDGRLAEIVAELKEEEDRKQRLANLESNLSAIQQARQSREEDLKRARQIAAVLQEQQKRVASLSQQVEATRRRLQDNEARRAARQAERESYAGVVAKAAAIQQAYADWQQARRDLEQWETVAAQFRQHEARRQPFLDTINAARARLLQEQQTLLAQEAAVAQHHVTIEELQTGIAQQQSRLTDLESQLTERVALEAHLEQARQRQAEARAENPRLKAEMDQLKTRIDQLSRLEGANCPLCGQPLSEADRQRHIVELTAEGKTLGDRYRANLALLKEADRQMAQYKAEVEQLARLEDERLAVTQTLASHTARLEQIQQIVDAWERQGVRHLAEVTAALDDETYAAEARAQLATLDAELKAIGYDAASHDEARRREQAGRSAEADLRSLERAQAALIPLERELADLVAEQAQIQEDLQRAQTEYEAHAAALAAAQAEMPDLEAAERQFLDLQEKENQLRTEVGAARQKVLVLDDLKHRRKELEAERDEKAQRVGQYKQLERAFGKDGVPALLIEQALPQIETRANNVLERLSGGNMTVRFVTQAAYKDKKREDLRETLDIQISDGAGSRDYEMFSGGEAFRVNFAIRLALSEVLAQRAGAKLQTLVIDEGFGSQDALGRQRLVEAINLVKSDFAKILVITHLDELKDAFPSRIEVEKTERGSVVRVV